MTLSRVVELPRKFDAPNEELLLLVEVERQVDGLRVVVDVDLRRRREVDIAVYAV